MNEKLSFFRIKIDINAVQIGFVLTNTTFSDKVTYLRPSNIMDAPIAPKRPLEIN